MRDADSVSRIWKSISPATRGQDADNYWAEPYATPGNVDGPLSDKPGRAGWTWYTGSAAWLNRVCLEWVLGIRPVWDANNQSEGLLIDPCPPLELGKVNVTRTWRGQPIRVRFDAAEFSPDRRAVLVVDGETIVGNVLPEELVSRTSLAGPLAGPLAGQKRTPIDVLVKWTAAPASEIELSRAVAARNGMSKPSASQPREKPVSPAPRP
jgi:cellobiose phosphorylase